MIISDEAGTTVVAQQSRRYKCSACILERLYSSLFRNLYFSSSFRKFCSTWSKLLARSPSSFTYIVLKLLDGMPLFNHFSVQGTASYGSLWNTCLRKQLRTENIRSLDTRCLPFWTKADICHTYILCSTVHFLLLSFNPLFLGLFQAGLHSSRKVFH